MTLGNVMVDLRAGLGSGGTGSTCVVVRRTSQNSVDAEVCSSTKV